MRERCDNDCGSRSLHFLHRDIPNGSGQNKLMGFWDKIMLRKRSIIETINDILKNVAQLVHSRHRSLDGFLVNVLSSLAAYCRFDKKPAINIDFELEEDNMQLQLL